MTVLDTNVASEVIKPTPDPAVVRWFDSQDRRTLAATTISVMEIRFGIARMPAGNRKQILAGFFREFFVKAVAEVVSFDVPAAEEAGNYIAERDRSGQRLSDPRDAMIAGIVLQLAKREIQAVTLATRNEKHFLGLNTVNPWTA